MRIYKILFFSALLFFTACASEEKVPANVIQPERMAHILAEVHVVDGMSYSLNQAPDSLYKNTMGYYVELFKKYKTDSTAFKKSYTWYTLHPAQLDKIYDDVTQIMTAKSDSLSKAKSKNVVPAKQLK